MDLYELLEKRNPVEKEKELKSLVDQLIKRNEILLNENKILKKKIDNLEFNVERLNNKINSIFSNFEQFINSYKNDNLDDFFIVLRLSEVVEFYNDLKEVIKSE